MHLEKYSIDCQTLIDGYQLSEEQLRFVKSPQENVETAKSDTNRMPVLALADSGECLGFFVLHEHSEFEDCFKLEKSIYVRSFSIDQRHLRQGYAGEILLKMPEFVEKHYPHIEYITLLVDQPNPIARDMYLKAGFELGQLIQGVRYPAYTMVKKLNKFESYRHC